MTIEFAFDVPRVLVILNLDRNNLLAMDNEIAQHLGDELLGVEEDDIVEREPEQKVDITVEQDRTGEGIGYFCFWVVRLVRSNRKCSVLQTRVQSLLAHQRHLSSSLHFPIVLFPGRATAFNESLFDRQRFYKSEFDEAPRAEAEAGCEKNY